MDREKAKKTNSKGSIALFTEDKDNLNSIEKSKLKDIYLINVKKMVVSCGMMLLVLIING